MESARQRIVKIQEKFFGFYILNYALVDVFATFRSKQGKRGAFR